MPYKQLLTSQTALQLVTSQDEHPQQLKEHIIGWPDNKDQILQYMRPYWTFHDDMEVTDRVILKGRYVVIPEILQRRALQHLHVNHMGIKKTKLLACESIY